MQTVPPIAVNGWTIYVHPLFLGQVRDLAIAVSAAKARNPETYKSRNDAKRLAAILKLAFEIIPQDPPSPAYRQGGTLGDGYKHWFRAKFFQQYRLFFRFDTASRTIIYAWVNDEGTKRAYGSKSDAYRVFGLMLDSGHPPNDWPELEAACRESGMKDAAEQTFRLGSALLRADGT